MQIVISVADNGSETMTALEQVSAKYEQAKRDYAEAVAVNASYTVRLREAAVRDTWGEALTILQGQR